MNEPWFDPIKWAWVPGTFFGVFGGFLGALGGTLAPLGRARTLVIGTWVLSIACALIMLLTAVVAFFSGQPYGIWYGLGLPGLIGTIVLSALLPVMLLRYRQAEERKLAARDLQ